MATNLMNILGMMGQQEPEYGSRAWRERAGQMRLPSIFQQSIGPSVATTRGGDVRRELEQALSFETDPESINSILELLGEGMPTGTVPYPPGSRPQRFKKEDRSWLAELFKDLQFYTPGSQGQQLGGRPPGMGGLSESEKESLGLGLSDEARQEDPLEMALRGGGYQAPETAYQRPTQDITQDIHGVPYLYPDPKRPPIPETPWYEHAAEAALGIPSAIAKGTGQIIGGGGGGAVGLASGLSEAYWGDQPLLTTKDGISSPLLKTIFESTRRGVETGADFYGEVLDQPGVKQKIIESLLPAPVSAALAMAGGAKEVKKMLKEGEKVHIPAEKLKPEEKPAKDPDKEKEPIDEKVGAGALDQETADQFGPQMQAMQAQADEWGVTLLEAFKRKAQEDLGVGRDDLDTFMTDITQRLTEALDRKPGWPEFLMAFGMALQGQDGVGYLHAMNQQYLGQAQVLGGLLGEARSEKSRRQAAGISQGKAYQSVVEKQIDKNFKRREKKVTTALSSIGKMLAENSREQRKFEDLGEQATPALIKERNDLLTQQAELFKYQQTLYGQ